MPEPYLGPYQTPMMEHFLESSKHLLSVNCFTKELYRRCSIGLQLLRFAKVSIIIQSLCPLFFLFFLPNDNPSKIMKNGFYCI